MVTTILCDWVSILCLLVWGVWLSRRLRLAKGFAPLLGCSFVMVLLQLFGMAKLLMPGAVLLYLGAAALVVLALRQKQVSLRGLLCPGLAAFAAAVLVLQAGYALRVPRFQTYDELSHWGVFFKAVFYNRQFAQWDPLYGLVHSSYPQGAAALYALFRPLRTAYAERDMFFVTNLPILAVSAALVEALTPGETAGALPRGLHLLCGVAAAPLLFWIFAPDTPYTTAYMDAPVGALFAGALLLVMLPLPETDRLRRGLAVALLTAALTTVKEIGMVFALCVLGIWFLQCLLAAVQQRRAGVLAKPFLLAGGLCAGVLGSWKVFINLTDCADDQFSHMGMGYFLQCWQEARTGVDPYFYTIWNNFYSRVRRMPLLAGFSTFKIGMLCAMLGCVVAALLLWKARRPDLALVPLCMTVYWPCYLAVLFYVYIGGMSPYEAERVASYDRYACCFFLGWFPALLYCLWTALRALPGKKHAALGQKLGLVCSLLLAVIGAKGFFAGSTPLVDTVTLPYEEWRDRDMGIAAEITEAVGADYGGILWVLSADSESAYRNQWFFHYELLPLHSSVDVRPYQQDANLWYNIEEHDITALALLGLDDSFAEEYGSLFEDSLSTARTNGEHPTVYDLTPERTFVPRQP